MAAHKAHVSGLLAGLAALALALGIPAPAGADVLTSREVLTSSAKHAPMILEALADARAARGAALSAEGSFDTRVTTEGYGRFSGFWDGRVISTTVEQDLRTIGATVFGGYKLSDGNFPIYEDINFTNTGGEFKTGFVLSLLRDRAFDTARAGLVDASLGLTQADIDVLVAQIGVQHKALTAYQVWVATGAQLEIYRNLLNIGLEREKGLKRRATEGDVADVLVIENRQNILRRQTLVVEAERELRVAALALSMFNRDQGGEPVVPEADELPNGFPQVMDEVSEIDDAAMVTARAVRPELRLVDNNLQRARNDLRLARNDLLPTLDFKYEVSRDFGTIAEGGASRDSTDNILGIVFQIPLQRRAAKGRMAIVRAEMQALEFQRQRLEEQIVIEIRTLRAELNAAREMVGLAIAEQEQAERMQAFEKTRFENGISDFFLLNMREERAADARIRRISAQLRYFVAVANYYAAIVDLVGLGLDGPDPSLPEK